MIQKILSPIIIMAYIVVIYLTEGLNLAIKFLLFSIIPLTLIWFNAEIGGFIMKQWLDDHEIKGMSPCFLIRITGWGLIIFSILFVFIFKIF